MNKIDLAAARKAATRFETLQKSTTHEDPLTELYNKESLSINARNTTLPAAVMALCDRVAELEARLVQEDATVQNVMWERVVTVGNLRKKVAELEAELSKARAAVEDIDLREGHVRDNADPDQLRAMLLGAGLEIAKLRAQLPKGMEHCTIVFRTCKLGHGWLTATNWVPFNCPTCERDRLRAALQAVVDHSHEICPHQWQDQVVLCLQTKARAALEGGGK